MVVGKSGVVFALVKIEVVAVRILDSETITDGKFIGTPGHRHPCGANGRERLVMIGQLDRDARTRYVIGPGKLEIGDTECARPPDIIFNPPRPRSEFHFRAGMQTECLFVEPPRAGHVGDRIEGKGDSSGFEHRC